MNFLILFVLGIFCVNLVSPSKDKCRSDEVLCIKACCNSTDFAKANPEKCETTWKFFNLSLDTKLHVFNGNHRYMKLLLKFWNDVSVPCLRSKDKEWSWSNNDPNLINSTHIPDYCFTQVYDDQTKKYEKKPLDCATEFTWYRYGRYIIICGLILSILLLLSTIFIYMTIKELKDNMRLKLFIWYLSSLVISHTTMVGCVYIIWNYTDQLDTLSVIIGFIASYFFLSTYLCMNVIGFEMWITFRELSADNSLRCDRKRFKCYAIYVWSVPIIFYILYFLTLNNLWSFVPIAINILYLFTFVYLAYTICRTRYKVANLREDRNPIRESIKIILSMFFMMGLPRLVFLVFLLLGDLAYYMISKYLFLSLEAPLIFKLFVLKRNVWMILKDRYLCHRYTRTLTTTTTSDMSTTL